MPASQQKLVFQHLKKRTPRICEKCGAQMRLRLTDSAIVDENKQLATYICGECQHTQTYTEYLEADLSSG